MTIDRKLICTSTDGIFGGITKSYGSFTCYNNSHCIGKSAGVFDKILDTAIVDMENYFSSVRVSIKDSYSINSEDGQTNRIILQRQKPYSLVISSEGFGYTWANIPAVRPDTTCFLSSYYGFIDKNRYEANVYNVAFYYNKNIPLSNVLAMVDVKLNNLGYL